MALKFEDSLCLVLLLRTISGLILKRSRKGPNNPNLNVNIDVEFQNFLKPGNCIVDSIPGNFSISQVLGPGADLRTLLFNLFLLFSPKLKKLAREQNSEM